MKLAMLPIENERAARKRPSCHAQPRLDLSRLESPRLDAESLARFRVRFQQLVERGFGIFGNDEPFFLWTRLHGFALRFFAFRHCRGTLKLIPAPGVGPGRPCHRPRGCKPRAFACFATQGSRGRAINCSSGPTTAASRVLPRNPT